MDLGIRGQWPSVTLLVVILLSLAPNVPFAYSQTVTVDAIADTYIAKSEGNSNFGAHNELKVRPEKSRIERTLLALDLSSIPSSATVNAATLKLFLAKAPHSNRLLDVHRISAKWVETQASWNNRLAGTPWANAGADFVSTVVASAATGTKDDVTLSWTVTSLVQAWVSGTAENYGCLVKDADETGSSEAQSRFRSREYSNVDQRPKLVISFTVATTVTQTTITTTATVTTTTQPTITTTSTTASLTTTTATQTTATTTATTTGLPTTTQTITTTTTFPATTITTTTTSPTHTTTAGTWTTTTATTYLGTTTTVTATQQQPTVTATTIVTQAPQPIPTPSPAPTPAAPPPTPTTPGAAGVTFMGSIRDAHGRPVVGVTLSSSTGQIAITDDAGNWALTVSFGVRGTITPSKLGYTFTPPSQYFIATTPGQVSFLASPTSGTPQPTPSVPFQEAKRITQPVVIPGFTLDAVGLGALLGLTLILFRKRKHRA